jgi:hypothetical protein
MVVTHKHNIDNNSFTITLDTVSIIVDPEQFTYFLNFNKRWIIDADNQYPYYNSNYKKYNILEFLYKFKSANITYHFKNNNHNDLRKNNVIIYHDYHATITEKYSIKTYIPGHYSECGKDAFIMKNPIWVTTDNVYLMYCETNTLCKLCELSYNKIKKFERIRNSKITFYSHTDTGYISGNGGEFYIHQIIMNYHGHGKGTKNGSIDHINRDVLDNTYNNLRIATHEIQQANKNGTIEGTKRKRSKSAKHLPDGLLQEMMPKYVGYYSECYNKEKGIYREFFKIEGHPKIEKPVCSSKSCKLTIFEKLEEIKEKLANIENDVVIVDPNKLPQYYRISTVRNAPHMFYERRTDRKRYGMNMKLKPGIEITAELERLNGKLHKKFPELL